LARTLESVKDDYGVPRMIRVDNGPEFVSKEPDLWAYCNNVILDFSRPGKSADNAFIESFNARVRQECLNEHWFLFLEDARSKIAEWHESYNHERPHSMLVYKTPEEFAKTHQNMTKKQDKLSQKFAESVA
jgi:putative transposase